MIIIIVAGEIYYIDLFLQQLHVLLSFCGHLRLRKKIIYFTKIDLLLSYW